MQVSVESLDGLQRRLTVQVPSDDIEKEVEQRLKSLGSRVKVDGFRPGKVPFKVIKQRYDGQVRYEVLQSVIQKSYYEAVSKENLRPAGEPSIEPGDMKPGEDFKYTATIEVYPEIKLNDCAGETLEKTVAEVTDADVDKLLEKLQVQRVTFNSVDRGAKEEDQIVIDFLGKIDGEPFDGGKAEKHKLVLGSKTMIEGFEEQLEGLKAGDEKTIEVTFPESYQAENLAGKPATFDIKVHEVNEPVLPELDDEFAKSFGNEKGLDAFKQEVRENMEMELDNKLNSLLRKAVFDLLLSNNEVQIPSALERRELEALKNQLKQSYQQQVPNMDISKISDDMLPVDELRKQATERVNLSLLLSESINQLDIKMDSPEIKARTDAILQKMAASYDDPDGIIAQYRQNQQWMDNIQGQALEEEVVAQLVSKMNVTEKSASFDEVMNQTEQ